MTVATSRTVPSVSFEFFPPATAKGSQRLWASVERLAPLAPDFVSVTYGAGGTTRDRTRAAIQAIIDRAGLPVAGHLTCVGASREETLGIADEYRRIGARRIVALRGDPPKDAERFEAHPEGFRSSVELIRSLREAGHERISVGAYPEKHPEAADEAADIDWLKRKLDAGGDMAVTQFFFENETFLRFRDRAAKAGITAPIVPGVIPIENYAKMKRFADMCAANVPAWLTEAYEGADDAGTTPDISREICARQCEGLLDEGAERIHFYTLNNPDITYDICARLGVTPKPARVAAAGGAGA